MPLFTEKSISFDKTIFREKIAGSVFQHNIRPNFGLTGKVFLSCMKRLCSRAWLNSPEQHSSLSDARLYKNDTAFPIDFFRQVILYKVFFMRLGRIAQLEEPSAHNRSVVGSNPTAPTMAKDDQEQAESSLKRLLLYIRQGRAALTEQSIAPNCKCTAVKGTFLGSVPFLFCQQYALETAGTLWQR